MPTIELKKESLDTLLGKSLSIEELEEYLHMFTMKPESVRFNSEVDLCSKIESLILLKDSTKNLNIAKMYADQPVVSRRLWNCTRDK